MTQNPTRKRPTMNDVEEGIADIILHCPDCSGQELSFVFFDVSRDQEFRDLNKANGEEEELTDVYCCMDCSKIFDVLVAKVTLYWSDEVSYE